MKKVMVRRGRGRRRLLVRGRRGLTSERHRLDAGLGRAGSAGRRETRDHEREDGGAHEAALQVAGGRFFGSKIGLVIRNSIEVHLA